MNEHIRILNEAGYSVIATVTLNGIMTELEELRAMKQEIEQEKAA